MRIGLFTDTYRPSVNGIVYVAESLKRNLEANGHEVFIFCPARSMRPSEHAKTYDEDEHVVRFSSVKGAFYDDYDTSLFFPPRVLAKIRELDLDVIHFLTPGQIGMMGIYAAYKIDIPLVAQHCTDLRQYVEHYSDPLLLPGILALISMLPFTVNTDVRDLREIVKLYRPRRERTKWNMDVVERMVTLVYSKCDAVIALSAKSKQQLESWQSDNYRYEVTLMPNGVTEIAQPTGPQQRAFQKLHGIEPSDTVLGFVGRLGAEKNLDVLIDAMTHITEEIPSAKLLFVGDFEYRETLEKHAAESSQAERIVFTGALPREELGVAYASMQLFVFPSLTDTQGWVIHEAAQFGLPILLIDRHLTDVMIEGRNGAFAENSDDSIARAAIEILSDQKALLQMSAESKKIVAGFSEAKQIEKLIGLYESVCENYVAKPPRRRFRKAV